MAKTFTMGQLKICLMFMGISLSKYLQIESNTGVEITPIQEENKGLRSEVQVRQESLDFQDETYDKK